MTDPTPEEIDAACAHIRATWTPEEELRRCTHYRYPNSYTLTIHVSCVLPRDEDMPGRIVRKTL